MGTHFFCQKNEDGQLVCSRCGVVLTDCIECRVPYCVNRELGKSMGFDYVFMLDCPIVTTRYTEITRTQG